MEFFPDNDDVHERVARFWKFRKGFPVPRDHDSVRCGVCGHSDYIIRWYQFRRHPNSPHHYRADVGMKCRICSHHWGCGVVITEATFRERVGQKQSREYTWRQARDIIRGTA